MSFQSPSSQECYFYQGKWDEENVGVFVRVLMDDVMLGVWEVGGDNYHELLAAQEFVNVMLDKDFCWDEVVALVNLLKKRYTTFRRVLDTKGVNWDRRYNHVHATPEVWDKLFKWDDFTKAFYHKGDAMYENLKSLFGTEDVVPPGTIVISSDGPTVDEPNNATRPIIIPDSPNPEVTSPLFLGRKPPRKKLFSET